MSELDKFRKDFALVWKTWIGRGEETHESFQAAGKAVKAHMNNAGWMRAAMAHFAEMADEIRSDEARSERIRQEVRAERRVAA